MKHLIKLIVALLFFHLAFSQERKDSLGIKLNEVEVKARPENDFGISRLNNIEGVQVNAGKKSEAIYLDQIKANLAANNSRQIFSKVPGINVFENDGSGLNIGIGSRGLNPNRISNFNMRQNGYDISADALGYPESYYLPPAFLVERIEILRGAAGLQFGTQFGGMINFKLREHPQDKKFSVLSAQTLGSFGLFNSYNQFSVGNAKRNFLGAFQYKKYNGWRPDSWNKTYFTYLAPVLQLSPSLKLKMELTFMDYLMKMPGGLTDAMFEKDMAISTRSRNWMDVRWILPAITLDYTINPTLITQARIFKLYAHRYVLGYMGRPDRPDDTASNRNLISDLYDNWGAEFRMVKRYYINKSVSHFLLGTRIYKGNTTRKQGDADKSDRPQFQFLNPNMPENSSYVFPSSNVAVFMENVFSLGNSFYVVPGLRWEWIDTRSDGFYRILNKDLAGNILLDQTVKDNRELKRNFFIGGFGIQWKYFREHECYANVSQNYRSVNFNDMRIVNPNFQVDPNLKDEKGYTSDIGLRGKIKNYLYYDASLFYMLYDNRIGTSLKMDTFTFQVVRYRTNIGKSRSMGAECFVEADWWKMFSGNQDITMSVFMNVSYTDAKYLASKEKSFIHKKVEYAPELIIRSGIRGGYKNFTASLNFNYTSEQYSDATNSNYTTSGLYGIIPSYRVVDLSMDYRWKFLFIGIGIQNLTDEKYFTRRAEGYPGPGIIPADPRNFYVNLKVAF
ncbi:MAG: TonB-dependent receptor [Bacteroidia bacterium]|nr:TonB-dependent receptor [Bacteroidia bacterium]